MSSGSKALQCWPLTAINHNCHVWVESLHHPHLRLLSHGSRCAGSCPACLFICLQSGSISLPGPPPAKVCVFTVQPRGPGCCTWCSLHITATCRVGSGADTDSGKMMPQLCQVPTCTTAALQGVGDNMACSELRVYQAILTLRNRRKPFTFLECLSYERKRIQFLYWGKVSLLMKNP